MSKILVTYATMAGSTAEVAREIAGELGNTGSTVDVLPIEQAGSLASYDAVVVGAPMIVGWHRAALGFLRKNRRELQGKPLAIFVLAMSLTEPRETKVDGVPIVVDEKLVKPPAVPGKLSFRERYAQLNRYIHPILKAANPATPVSVAVFGGRLEYGRLPWWGVMFALLVIRAPAGDKRNWTLIQSWAAKLPEAFQKSGKRAEQVAQPA